MSQQNQEANLRLLLLVIAIVFASAATLLYLYYSRAATVIGSSPEQAITMVSGTNSGILQPGERRWFRITPNSKAGRFRDMSLSMMFIAQDLSGANSVNFQLFADGEIDAWPRSNCACGSVWLGGIPGAVMVF